jgi:hypothetical protein
MQSSAPAGFSRAFPARKRSPAEAGSRAFAKDEPPAEAGGKDELQPVFFTPPLTSPLANPFQKKSRFFLPSLTCVAW